MLRADPFLSHLGCGFFVDVRILSPAPVKALLWSSQAPARTWLLCVGNCIYNTFNCPDSASSKFEVWVNRLIHLVQQKHGSDWFPWETAPGCFHLFSEAPCNETFSVQSVLRHHRSKQGQRIAFGWHHFPLMISVHIHHWKILKQS